MVIEKKSLMRMRAQYHPVNGIALTLILMPTSEKSALKKSS